MFAGAGGVGRIRPARGDTLQQQRLRRTEPEADKGHAQRLGLLLDGLTLLRIQEHGVRNDCMAGRGNRTRLSDKVFVDTLARPLRVGTGVQAHER